MKYVRLSSEEEDANVLALGLEIKSNDRLLSQSLKVEEKKASQVFFINGIKAEILPCHLLMLGL